MNPHLRIQNELCGSSVPSTGHSPLFVCNVSPIFHHKSVMGITCHYFNLDWNWNWVQSRVARSADWRKAITFNSPVGMEEKAVAAPPACYLSGGHLLAPTPTLKFIYLILEAARIDAVSLMQRGDLGKWGIFFWIILVQMCSTKESFFKKNSFRQEESERQIWQQALHCLCLKCMFVVTVVIIIECVQDADLASS